MNEFYKIMRVFKNGETATDVLPSDKAKCLVGNSIFLLMVASLITFMFMKSWETVQL